MDSRAKGLLAGGIAALMMLATVAARVADELPSWNDGPAKSAIVAFVEKVTT